MKLVKENLVVDESSFGVFVPLFSRHLAQLGFHIAVSLDAVAVVVVEVVGNWACGSLCFLLEFRRLLFLAFALVTEFAIFVLVVRHHGFQVQADLAAALLDCFLLDVTVTLICLIPHVARYPLIVHH